MGIRARKNLLITVLHGRAKVARLEPKVEAQFELMYRRCRTEAEQDQVTDALRGYLDGWKDGDDEYSRLLRSALDFDDPVVDDDDAMPPALQAALERCKVVL